MKLFYCKFQKPLTPGQICSSDTFEIPFWKNIISLLHNAFLAQYYSFWRVRQISFHWPPSTGSSPGTKGGWHFIDPWQIASKIRLCSLTHYSTSCSLELFSCAQQDNAQSLFCSGGAWCGRRIMSIAPGTYLRRKKDDNFLLELLTMLSGYYENAMITLLILFVSLSELCFKKIIPTWRVRL